ncbi:MAG: hypothetical protein VZS44_09890 [Bacilli bacterium]|nr:hypothetical protein [Bacilli bacterium]
MIKKLKETYELHEKYSVEDDDQTYIVYEEGDMHLDRDIDKGAVLRDCFCDAYVSAKNYINEHNLEGKAIIKRTITITNVIEQEVY